MKEYLSKLLAPLAEKTGKEMFIYSGNGDCLYQSAPGTPPDIDMLVFKNETASLNGYTFFKFNISGHELTGALSGVDDNAGNYAYILSALLEKRAHSGDMSKEDKFRAVILGQTDLPLMYEMNNKFGKTNYYVFAVSFSKKDYRPLYDFLTQLCLEDDVAIGVDEHTVCLLKKQDDNDDYHSANEFAQLLNESIAQELGKPIMIGIGGLANSVSEIAEVYIQAVAAFRLGKFTDKSSNIYSYKELVMLKMIEDIPKETLKSYLNILTDKPTLEILADEEMMHTAKEFLANSLNISETARLMYMHRNTLIYRLDKIEKSTGLNIRNFSDAVTFRMIIILYSLLNAE